VFSFCLATATKADKSSQNQARPGRGNQETDQTMSCRQDLGTQSSTVNFVLVATAKAGKRSHNQARTATTRQGFQFLVAGL